MSLVLAITSGTTNKRPSHILRLCDHSCNLVSQFPTEIGHTISHSCCTCLYSMALCIPVSQTKLAFTKMTVEDVTKCEYIVKILV